MRIRHWLILALTKGVALMYAQGVEAPGPLNARIEGLAKLPLSFERLGESQFLARGRGYAVDIRGARAMIGLADLDANKAIQLEFIGGRQVVATLDKELPGKVNYIHGNDPKRWRMGLSTYSRVSYHDVYPGIDIVYYGNQNQLEFDLVLKPRAVLQSIRMRFTGAGTVRTDSDGNLQLGDLLLMVPRVIQGTKTIPGRYKVLASGEVSFEVAGYDLKQPLTIDPTLVYSSRLGGGNGSNQGNAVALDASGNIYIAGTTYAADLAVSNAAFAGYNANGDGFIMKLNPAGTTILYSTYIGGANYDAFLSLAVDASGAVWAVGSTASTDFPLLSPYQNTLAGGTDAMVVKLSPSGTLAYSTFLGSAQYDSAFSVAVDPSGNAYVTGQTSAGFPTTAGVFQPVSLPGGTDAFVTKFNSSNLLVWSTFVGGAGFDVGRAIAVDRFGNSYLAGISFSSSFPGAPPGGAQTTNHGGGDAFVAKLNFNASALLYFTFLGGSTTDQANAIGVDPTTGIAVVAGQTLSKDLATTPGAPQSANAGANNGFVAKLNASGSAFLYVTYLGGNRNDYIQSLALDPAGNTYVTGYTDSTTFPVRAALQPNLQGNATSVFHTSDAGTNWTAFDTNVPGTVTDLSPDPVNAGTLVASTESGIYITTNNGASWTKRYPQGSLNLTRSKSKPSVIYGQNCTSAYQSTDNGLTWTFRGPLPQCASRIVADPTNASVAYAFTYGTTTAPIQKTTDSGVTWTTASANLPLNGNMRILAAAPDGALYAGFYQDTVGIYKSSNQAATWVPSNTGLPANFSLSTLVAAASDPSRLYAVDFFNVYGSTNSGLSWALNGAAPALFVGCIPNYLAVAGMNPSILYWSPCYFPWATAPLSVSSNAGASWAPGHGINIATVNQIITDPLDANSAYAFSNVTYTPFVAKIDAGGQNLIYSTYLGDTGSAYGIASNGAGDAFVTGATSSKAFPISSVALQGNSYTSNPTAEIFLTRVSDSSAACTFTVNPQPYLAAPYEPVIQYSIVGPSGCPWTASSNQSWATFPNGSSGTGTAVVYVLLGVNNSGATRTATLTIGGQSVSLNQQPSGCGANFSAGSVTVPPGGGTIQLNVQDAAGCDWNILNRDPSAISVLSGASGTGNGSVTLKVAPNLGPNTRTFTFSIQQGGNETISQAGTTAPAVVSTIISSPSGVSITVTGTGCIPVQIDISASRRKGDPIGPADVRMRIGG